MCVRAQNVQRNRSGMCFSTYPVGRQKVLASECLAGRALTWAPLAGADLGASTVTFDEPVRSQIPSAEIESFDF